MPAPVKVGQYLVLSAVVLSLNFILPRLMPGHPLYALTSDQTANAAALLDDEMRQRLLSYYGLDKPPAQQYLAYWRNLARGDLGWSIYYDAPVAEVLWGRLRWTLLLMGLATAIYTVSGVFLGVLSARHHGRAADRCILVPVLLTGAWPPFFLGMLLIILLSARLGLFPMGGATGLAARGAPLGARVLDVLHHAFLPCLTLVLTHLSGAYLLVRSSMLGVLGEDYVRTARAKGLPEGRILWRHALPNALLPLVTMAAMRFGFLVMGALFVEVVFAYPGLGTLIYQACIVRDYPLLQGAFLLVMVSVMGCNLAADLLYGRLDPRVGDRVLAA